MHIRSFPLALGMTTGLANHRGWCTSCMKLASSSFSISSQMKFCRLVDCFRGLYWTGLASGLIFKWCSITSLGIPGICDGCQANTSILAWSKVIIMSSYLLSKAPKIRVV
jgi:hypothetical protein